MNDTIIDLRKPDPWAKLLKQNVDAQEVAVLKKLDEIRNKMLVSHNPKKTELNIFAAHPTKLNSRPEVSESSQKRSRLLANESAATHPATTMRKVTRSKYHSQRLRARGTLMESQPCSPIHMHSSTATEKKIAEKYLPQDRRTWSTHSRKTVRLRWPLSKQRET